MPLWIKKFSATAVRKCRQSVLVRIFPPIAENCARTTNLRSQARSPQKKTAVYMNKARGLSTSAFWMACKLNRKNWLSWIGKTIPNIHSHRFHAFPILFSYNIKDWGISVCHAKTELACVREDGRQLLKFRCTLVFWGNGCNSLKKHFNGCCFIALGSWRSERRVEHFTSLGNHKNEDFQNFRKVTCLVIRLFQTQTHTQQKK